MTLWDMLRPEAALSATAAVAYLTILTLLLPFGVHRLRLIWLRLTKPPRRAPIAWRGALPLVTVQLPIYNEANVVARLIDAACRLDYPRDRFEIQVLDDSDDDTVRLATGRVREWQARGVNIRHLRRRQRVGFKAGALAGGTAAAHGDFLLVLDADFVPAPDLLRRLLPPFSDQEVGAVQASWGHLNPEQSWLTRAQALLLDAHFAIEHEARCRAGLFFNFNGSAGMWRRQCLEAAGGWQADTLTEDLDLSYRAQLGGWRFVYLDEVRVPAELPDRIRPLELQQERWAQGGIQTALKILPKLWRQSLPTAVKVEATAHLLGHAVHPLTLGLGVALAGIGFLGPTDDFLPGWIHLAALALATVPFVTFYALAARLRGHGPLASARRVLEAMVLGLGLGVPLAGAVVRGVARVRTSFHRTPKRGCARGVGYRAVMNPWALVIRGGLGLALTGAVANLVATGMLAATPFTGLFAAGYMAATRESIRGDAVGDEQRREREPDESREPPGERPHPG